MVRPNSLGLALNENFYQPHIPMHPKWQPCMLTVEALSKYLN